MNKYGSSLESISLPLDELAPLYASGEVVLHFYDLTCPFCYVGQSKSSLLEAKALTVVELPFQAHPDVPDEGIMVPARTGPMYEVIAAQAQKAGLPLHWQPHLPNSRLALAAAEWTRQHQPDQFTPYQHVLFRAHFADGLNIGDAQVLLRLAADAGVNRTLLEAALADGTATAAVASSEQLGRRLGVTGTPAWMSAGRGIVGNQEPAAFERFATELGTSTSDKELHRQMR